MTKKKDNKNKNTIIWLFIIAVFLILFNAFLGLIGNPYGELLWPIGFSPSTHYCTQKYHVLLDIYEKNLFVEFGKIISFLYLLLIIVLLFFNKVKNKREYLIKGLLIAVCIFEIFKMINILSPKIYTNVVNHCRNYMKINDSDDGENTDEDYNTLVKYKYDISYENNKELIDNGNGFFINYQEYSNFVKENNLKNTLTENDFKKYNYVYCILTYDCGVEIKDIKDIKNNNGNINVIFSGNNNCKCCNNPLLYIIAVDKNIKLNKVTTTYDFN
ncbi:MAG: hypothetical protein VZS44_07195 [Bacilli bacterium]|nr:hypothetical protein [Bacilli bacterium]